MNELTELSEWISAWFAHEYSKDRTKAMKVAAYLAKFSDYVWQPIDTAPTDGTRVLLWEPGLVRPAMGYFHIFAFPQPSGRENYWSFDNGEHCREPSLWHPLPALPEVALTLIKEEWGELRHLLK